MTPTRTRTLVACLVLAVIACPAASDAQALSAFSKRKAEALLRDHLPCLGCHTLSGEGGTIGPDLTTVRQRRSAAYIAAIIADPQRVVAGSAMPKTPMPDETRSLIIRYFSQLDGAAPDEPVPGGRPVPAAAPDGGRLYGRWCASCHGDTGRGDGPNASHMPVQPAAHSSREAMSARPDDSLYDTIAAGGAVMNRSPRMPAFGATLSSAEIRALVRHIRTLCRCEGPPWSRNP